MPLLPISPDASANASSSPATFRLVSKNVSVSFDETPALTNVGVEVLAGESLALIGPNGAGKTTFLRAVLDLVPTTGELVVLGLKAKEARSKVAYVPQAEHLAEDFPISVFEVALMGRYRHAGWFRRPSQTDHKIAMDALERVGLADRKGDRFGTLSGGQRQRVLLARALCQQSALLLLDEPFNGVDVATTEVFVDVLNQLRSEGAGIVISTHDFSITRRIASHVCLLDTEQLGFGPVKEMLTAEHLRRTFGGQLLDTEDGTAFIVPSHH